MKGRVLIWRDYRGDVPASAAEKFFNKLMEGEADPSSREPVILDNGVTYLFIQHNNVYLMIATRQNANAASLLLFLHKAVEVFKYYFDELEEESLRDNFVIVYELLDEIMDFGYPQFTEAKILSEFIKTDSYRLELSTPKPNIAAVTNAVSWRSEGIRYKKNEVFLDVVESVNILVNSNGQVVRSEVVGALKMRTYLSGMPECKLGLNDRVLLEAQGRATKGKAIDLDDIKFHQCVRLARFENDRTISFIPPDGAFDLMTYRLSTQVSSACVFPHSPFLRRVKPSPSSHLRTQVKPLIWVEAMVERHSRSRVEYMVKARSQFKERSTATSVEIELPVPMDAIDPAARTSMGTATYTPEREAILWKIKSFPGGKVAYTPRYVWAHRAHTQQWSRRAAVGVVNTSTGAGASSSRQGCEPVQGAVEIELLVPMDAIDPATRTSMGPATYTPEREAILWKIKSFPRGKVSCLVASQTPSPAPPWALPPTRLRGRLCSGRSSRSPEVSRGTHSIDRAARTSMGSATYTPEREAILWKIKSFPGGKGVPASLFTFNPYQEYLLRAHFSLPSVAAEDGYRGVPAASVLQPAWCDISKMGKEYLLRARFSLPSVAAEDDVAEKKAPIRVKFEIPYFTVSGIQVRYLKIIEKSGYQALPWVRYITMAGEYELRMI
ncbi:unnamed protein product [Closterium sp. NIES-65]|nr:unnamed protein product [Closterium sp. NIES-65]